MIGGYFWTDSEIKKHLLPVIKSRLDGASHPHRVETAAMGTPPSVINYADYVESGLLLGLCPDDTVFCMKPPTFFERNKYYLALFFSLMALAVIYVIWLRRALYERSRRLEIMSIAVWSKTCPFSMPVSSSYSTPVAGLSTMSTGK